MPKSVLFNEQVPRLYYSIGEVCQRFNVSPSRIRFYEELGIKLHTKRNRKGERMFSEKDLVLVEKTLWLVNKMGVRTDFLKMHLQRMGLLPKDKFKTAEQGAGDDYPVIINAPFNATT